MSSSANSRWSRPETVAGFAASAPNPELLRAASTERGRIENGWVLDIGCGAGRNAIPLAQQGWRVLGVDASVPMTVAAAARARAELVGDRCHVAVASMDRLPVRDGSCDLVVAHGIWNLARSEAEFRDAVREAARVARAEAALFVFTFSRRTLPDDAQPVAGSSFVFTQFAGEPQCFLTRAQVELELGAAGFRPDPTFPLRELNRPPPHALPAAPTAPVIHEGLFRRG
jgi:SAM-dependent methyltransferase